jgi:hypothetical protein
MAVPECGNGSDANGEGDGQTSATGWQHLQPATKSNAAVAAQKDLVLSIKN